MEHIYNYFKKAFQKKGDSTKTPAVFVYLLSAILVTIPLNFAFGSISCILFLIVSFSTLYKIKFSYSRALMLPILFYCLMILSLFWTRDTKSTLAGLQKEIVFLFLPLAFLFIPKLSKQAIDSIFRMFSFSMVFYALYYFIKALSRYFVSGNTDVFFYHELVTKELNAIYVSVLASYAMFYFISLSKKSLKERTALILLILLVFLLSSKNIIVIDFLLIVIYYLFFSGRSKQIKVITVLMIAFSLLLSVVFVNKIRDRFLIEYETAFNGNTTNKNGKVCNISLKQAWSNEQFKQNDFFSGTAFRLYQIRIFKEMLHEENIFFTGFGLEASQDKIKEKAKQHNLYPEYGKFNFHNQYIQTFSELGIFGLLLLVLMVLINIKNAVVHKNFLHIVFTVTMITLFLTESFFCRQRGVIFFVTMYCIFNTTDVSKVKITLK
ncbi:MULTISPECIES: O-antigen ligase family protein [unclassified Flavobacterium]|jgi:O-antigen ligase|uniref:O-antigen ligase family protein n=1 Tax=unclassified Flavobacterium TaxID=196869 RepID=UPI0025BA6FCE|nr:MULTISPECIES: O-antigen ligase family protein [unclassified Flavobacterium]